MKKVKFIIKGIVLYTTIFSTLLFACAVDYIYDEGYFIYSSIIILLLWGICSLYIKEKEVKSLLFIK